MIMAISCHFVTSREQYCTHRPNLPVDNSMYTQNDQHNKKLQEIPCQKIKKNEMLIGALVYSESKSCNG